MQLGTGIAYNPWISHREGIQHRLALFQIVDARTKAVAWSTLLKTKLKNPGKMPKNLDSVAMQVAAKGLKTFPPRGGS